MAYDNVFTGWQTSTRKNTCIVCKQSISKGITHFRIMSEFNGLHFKLCKKCLIKLGKEAEK